MVGGDFQTEFWSTTIISQLDVLQAILMASDLSV
jgi:hypothetical protein